MRDRDEALPAQRTHIPATSFEIRSLVRDYCVQRDASQRVWWGRFLIFSWR